MRAQSSPDIDARRLAAVDWQTRQELGETLSRFALVRTVFAGGLALAGAVLLLVTGSSWQAWLILVAGATIAGASLIDLFRPITPDLTRRRVVLIAGSVFVMQACFIVATGGIRSPLIPILVPMAIVVALAIGDWRLYLSFAAAPILVVASLVVIDVLALLPPFVPGFFGGPAGVHVSAPWVVTIGSFLVFAMLIGGGLGLTVRRALTRAAAATAEAQRETLATMRERNVELIALSGTLAHELKNPLASIQGLSSLLRKKQPEGSREREQMDVLLSEAHRMGGILEEFLNFSRPVQGLAVEEVCPNRLLRDVARLYEPLTGERGISLHVEPQGHGHFAADPRKIKQVLVNLLQNAIDALDEGGHVTVRTGLAGGDTVRFEVEDDGPGLADDVRERLFRVGTTNKPGGSGLGLVIARSIAEQHGGSLELVSAPGAGVRAIFDVPRQAAGRPCEEE